MILFVVRASAMKVYCSIEFNQVMDKSLVILNFGKYITPLTDKEGKQLEFVNRVEVLNYMSSEGWVLEPLETLDGIHKTLIMSKDVKDENEIRQRFPLIQEVTKKGNKQ